MTLPVSARQWTITPSAFTQAQLGTNALTTKATKLGFKNLLVTLGWPVTQSCDGTTAGTAGDNVDRIPTVTQIVGNTPGNAHSWHVHRAPTGSGLGFIVVDHDSTADAGGVAASVFWSPAAGFTGGTTTARPTATDEQEITSGTNLFSTTNGAYTVHSWRCDQVGFEGMRMAIFATNNFSGDPVALFSIEKAAATPTAWSPPAMARYMGGSSPAGSRSDWTAAGWLARVAGTNRTLLAVGDAAPTAVDVDGDVLLAPSGLNNVTIGRVGFTDDWHYVADTTTVLTTFSDITGTRRWIALDEVVWPWNGSDSGAPNVVGAELLVNYDPVVATAIVSTDPDDGDPLGADFENGRWQKITLVWTIPDGFDPHLTVLMAGHSIWHTAYDGSAFSPLFSPHSTIQVAAGQATAVLLPIGGWWGAPDITPGIFKEAT